MVVFGECSCILAKVVVFGKKLLYSGNNGYIRPKWTYSRKSGCIRAKRLYSGLEVLFG